MIKTKITQLLLFTLPLVVAGSLPSLGTYSCVVEGQHLDDFQRQGKEMVIPQGTSVTCESESFRRRGEKPSSRSAGTNRLSEVSGAFKESMYKIKLATLERAFKDRKPKALKEAMLYIAEAEDKERIKILTDLFQTLGNEYMSKIIKEMTEKIKKEAL